MLLHSSIPARDPQAAATILGALWRTTPQPFLAFPGSWIVFADDGRGTCVEVYPEGLVLVPGRSGVEMDVALGRSNPTETHIAMAVEMDEPEIESLAHQHGLRLATVNRGALFRVMELWIEDAVLVEVLTPRMQIAYRRVMNSVLWQRMVGAADAVAAE